MYACQFQSGHRIYTLALHLHMSSHMPIHMPANLSMHMCAHAYLYRRGTFLFLGTCPYTWPYIYPSVTCHATLSVNMPFDSLVSGTPSYTYACPSPCAYIRACACAYTCSYTSPCAYACVCTGPCTYTCACACAYTGCAAAGYLQLFFMDMCFEAFEVTDSVSEVLCLTCERAAPG